MYLSLAVRPRSTSLRFCPAKFIWGQKKKKEGKIIDLTNPHLVSVIFLRHLVFIMGLNLLPAGRFWVL